MGYVRFGCVVNRAIFELNSEESNNLASAVAQGIGKLAAHEIGEQLIPKKMNITTSSYYENDSDSDPALYHRGRLSWQDDSIAALQEALGKNR